jgi:hypothetical protein
MVDFQDVRLDRHPGMSGNNRAFGLKKEKEG